MRKSIRQNLKVLTSLILILFLFMGFTPKNNNEKENIRSFSKFLKEDKITFRNVLDYVNGEAGILLKENSTLVILNVSVGASHFLNNYSLETKQLSKGYFRVGKGPGEVFGAMGVGICGNKIWMQDITMNKILMANKTEALKQGKIVDLKQYDIKSDFYKIAFKDSLHYFGVGSCSSKYKIQEVDLLSGKTIREFGAFNDVPEKMNFYAWKDAHACFIQLKPNNEKLVLFHRFTDAIEIYDVKTEDCIKVKGPEQFDVEFQLRNEVMIRNNKTRFAFTSGAAVTDKYIYLCYSGDFTHKRNYYANCVFIYDWHGNPVRKLTFDTQIESLAVSDDDKTLYSYDVNTGCIVEANIE